MPAKTASLACTSVKIVRSKQAVLLDTLTRKIFSRVIEICSIEDRTPDGYRLSKLNRWFTGYFDPENVLLHNENIYYPSELHPTPMPPSWPTPQIVETKQLFTGYF